MENTANQCFQLTVKSVIFFAKAKKLPLFTSTEAVVSTLGEFSGIKGRI